MAVIIAVYRWRTLIILSQFTESNQKVSMYKNAVCSVPYCIRFVNILQTLSSETAVFDLWQILKLFFGGTCDGPKGDSITKHW
jgi:hypothetical protein